MKKRYSVEQITAVLQQADQVLPLGNLCRKVGISEHSLSVEEGLRQCAAERSARAEAAAQ